MKKLDKIESIESYEYPTHAQLFELKKNSWYFYVSSSYCNGFVNYLENKSAFLICRYTYNCPNRPSIDYRWSIDYSGCTLDNVDRETTHKDYFDNLFRIENICDNKWYHTDLGLFCNDDVIITGEIEDSYIMIYFDTDISDCEILRCSKEEYNSLSDFNEAVVNMIEEDRNNLITQIREPKGWIKF